MATVKVRNVSPLGEVENFLARRKFTPGEEVELDEAIAGTEPSVRDYVEGEFVPPGHLIVEDDGTKRVVVPGTGLLGQPENFVRVVEAVPAGPVRVERHPKTPEV